MSLGRPVKVVLYAAFIGLLLASYVGPLQQMRSERDRISGLRADLHALQETNEDREQEIRDLNTPAGIERAARERYGMVYPGETVYVVPERSQASGVGGQDGKR